MNDTTVTIRERINLAIEHAFTGEAAPDRLFSLGLLCYMARLLPEAYRLFSRVHERCPTNPLYTSFYGLTVLVVEKDPARGLKLCKSALNNDYVNPEVYWILGQVYLLNGQKRNAYRTFKNGLFIHNNCACLETALKKLGVRKKSVFPLLPRSHSLNIFAGKLRALSAPGEKSGNQGRGNRALSLPVFDLLQSNEKKLWVHLSGHNEVSLDRLWLMHT